MFGIPRLYALIGIGVVVALFAAWVWRIDTLRAQHLKERDAAVAGLKTSEDSLKLCRGAIDENNRATEARGKALVEAQKQAAADLARADARWEAAKSTVSALEASARDKTAPACKTSQRALESLEGL